MIIKYKGKEYPDEAVGKLYLQHKKDTMKNEIKKIIDSKYKQAVADTEIDVHLLESFTRDDDSGMTDWDKDEELEDQITKASTIIEEDGFYEWLGCNSFSVEMTDLFLEDECLVEELNEYTKAKIGEM